MFKKIFFIAVIVFTPLSSVFSQTNYGILAYMKEIIEEIKTIEASSDSGSVSGNSEIDDLKRMFYQARGKENRKGMRLRYLLNEEQISLEGFLVNHPGKKSLALLMKDVDTILTHEMRITRNKLIQKNLKKFKTNLAHLQSSKFAKTSFSESQTYEMIRFSKEKKIDSLHVFIIANFINFHPGWKNRNMIVSRSRSRAIVTLAKDMEHIVNFQQEIVKKIREEKTISFKAYRDFEKNCEGLLATAEKLKKHPSPFFFREKGMLAGMIFLSEDNDLNGLQQTMLIYWKHHPNYAKGEITPVLKKEKISQRAKDEPDFGI